MTTEELLRDATHAYADPIEPAPDAWSRIRRRLEPARRSRRPIAWAVAAAVLVAAGVGVFALVRSIDDDQGVETVSPKPAATMPSEVVVVTADDRVVVLDAATGIELRTIAEGAMTVPDGPSLATDGETVFFTRDSGNRCDTDLDGDQEPITEIASVGVDGGPVERLVAGVQYPTLSPDGRYLAYTGIRNCSDGAGQILLYDRTTSLEQPGYAARPRSVIYGLAWASNSRDILFVLANPPQGGSPRVLDTAAPVPLEETPLVLIGDGSGVDEYLGNTGRLLGTYAAAGDDPDQSIRVIAIDPVITTNVDGPPSEFHELFRIPEQCCGQQLSSDASGDHILAVSSSGDLYRWSAGEATPTKIATGISAAAWAG